MTSTSHAKPSCSSWMVWLPQDTALSSSPWVSGKYSSSVMGNAGHYFRSLLVQFHPTQWWNIVFLQRLTLFVMLFERDVSVIHFSVATFSCANHEPVAWLYLEKNIQIFWVTNLQIKPTFINEVQFRKEIYIFPWAALYPTTHHGLVKEGFDNMHQRRK